MSDQKIEIVLVDESRSTTPNPGGGVPESSHPGQGGSSKPGSPGSATTGPSTRPSDNGQPPSSRGSDSLGPTKLEFLNLRSAIMLLAERLLPGKIGKFLDRMLPQLPESWHKRDDSTAMGRTMGRLDDWLQTILGKGKPRPEQASSTDQPVVKQAATAAAAAAAQVFSARAAHPTTTQTSSTIPPNATFTARPTSGSGSPVTAGVAQGIAAEAASAAIRRFVGHADPGRAISVRSMGAAAGGVVDGQVTRTMVGGTATRAITAQSTGLIKGAATGSAGGALARAAIPTATIAGGAAGGAVAGGAGALMASVGAVTALFAGLVVAGAGLLTMFRRTGAALEEYSGAIAGVMADDEARKEERASRRADRIGEPLANIMDSSNKMGDAFYNMWTAILENVLRFEPLITLGVDGITKIINLIEMFVSLDQLDDENKQAGKDIAQQAMRTASPLYAIYDGLAELVSKMDSEKSNTRQIPDWVLDHNPFGNNKGVRANPQARGF